jgi:hypothetical protein
MGGHRHGLLNEIKMKTYSYHDCLMVSRPTNKFNGLRGTTSAKAVPTEIRTEILVAASVTEIQVTSLMSW